MRYRDLRLAALGMALLSAFAGACGDAEPPAPRAVPRQFVEVDIDTVWSRGGMADTVIELPLFVRADGDLLLFADGARPGVAALRTADGGTAWTVGRKGRGPGEFERPAVVEVLPDGRLLIADTEVGRVTILDRAGSYLGEFPVENAQLSGLCALDDGSIVTVAATEGENFARLSDAGAVLSRHAVPWSELRDQSLLARQFVAATSPDRKQCFFALSLGRGFTAFDGERFLYAKDYIEPVGEPSVQVRQTRSAGTRVTSQAVRGRTIATRSVAATADGLYVLFEGSTDDAGRVIDVYTPAGEYEHSFRLREPAEELAWSDGTFYLVSQNEGIPVVTALRVRRRP